MTRACAKSPMKHQIRKARETLRLLLDLSQINQSRVSKRHSLLQICFLIEMSHRQKDCGIETEVTVVLVKKVPPRLPNAGFCHCSSTR